MPATLGDHRCRSVARVNQLRAILFGEWLKLAHVSHVLVALAAGEAEQIEHDHRTARVLVQQPLQISSLWIDGHRDLAWRDGPGISKENLTKSHAEEKAAQRSFRRGTRSLPQLRVRERLALESHPRELEELRSLLRVKIRSDDLRFPRLQLNLSLKWRQLDLDSGARDAQVRFIDLRELKSEVNVGKNDCLAARRTKRVPGPVEHVGPK